jgi:eukaryotic-like serine/threonine-protein kinase
VARPLERTDSAVARSERESASSLDIAARSILESHAIGGTIASVVADRALDHHWEGLFQHAAIRVGPKRAIELLERLEQEIEAASSESIGDAMGAAPTPRSHLYGRLRRLLSEIPSSPMLADAPGWWRPADESFRERLAELRRALAGAHAEVAELRFTRRLGSGEVAHVLGVSLKEVERGAAEAVKLAEKLLGRRPPSRDPRPEGALLEAFALDPRQLRAPRRRLRRPVLRMGAVIANRYEVEELLGAGAFADVYRARDREVTDHVVALKILRTPPADARAVRSAMRELQLIASVFHPSVVQLKDHGWHDGHLWFVMPLYRGETLATRLRRGPLGRREAREIFEPLAEALSTMHRAGVLHQDVKPENVFLANIDPEGDAGNAPRRILPVLLDLGVAAKDAELVLAGTPAYFAPEVAARFAGAPDPAPVGPKADVFSLALTLRHALEPSPGEDVAGGAVDAFIAFRATRPAAIPKRRDLRDLRPSFERWLHFSPDGRPSADEFRRELHALTRPAEKAARRWALMRWAVPTAIALLALFSAIVYVLSREASVQRVEAIHARERANEARQRAASISASLTVQQARRRQLEADVARLEQEYQTSRMTREQLASRLAQAEGELEVLADQKAQQAQRMQKQSDEIRTLRDERSALVAEIAGLRDRRSELSAKLEKLESAVDSERTRRLAGEVTANGLRESVRKTELELERARTRIGELETRIAVLRQAWTAPTPNRHGATERPARSQ